MLARARYRLLVGLALLLLPGSALAEVVCPTSDPLVKYQLRFTLDAIDASCPCLDVKAAGARVKCAKPLIAARITSGELPATCKNDALAHVKKSVCGRPGAVVCCGVRSNGKTAHKIAPDAAKCIDTPKLDACVSVAPSLPRGCDATGCIPTVCGDALIDGDESCDPPITGICDAACHLIPCGPPVSACGNGMIDAGEACDPPGVGSCGKDCQLASCAAAGPGEIAVACVESAATVAAGSGGSDYLLAWTAPTYRPEADVVARRFDADGVPVDPAARVVSAGVPCGSTQTSPAIGGDGNGYVVEWEGSGPIINQPGPYAYSIYARASDNAAVLGPRTEIAMAVPFGMCTSVVTTPLAIAPAPFAGPRTFVALWQLIGGCAGGPLFDVPDGSLLDYTTPTPTLTSMTIGSFPVSLPAILADSPAAIASLPGDTLAAWHVHLQSASPPTVSNPSVTGAWFAANGSITQFLVSSRQLGIGSALRPTVAAATDRFLVAWAEGPVSDATEIRGMRVTHAIGPLDADGGLLLATAGGAVRGGPVAAFDGSVWLVAWTEVGVGGNDLRAVAVQPDGTVLDASPRLLASGLGNAEPAIASKGDGRSLVIYVRPDGGSSAVRAQLVPGN